MKNRHTSDQTKDWQKEIELVDSSDFHKNKQSELLYFLARFFRGVRDFFFGSPRAALKTASFFLTLAAALKVGIIELWLITWGVFLIFDNLGKRQKGTLSAYSIFNPNFEKPIGSFENPYRSLSASSSSKSPAKQEKKVAGTEDVDEADLPVLYFTKAGKFSNKECYCGSLQKYKKCCYPLDLKFGPTNQARTPLQD